MGKKQAGVSRRSGGMMAVQKTAQIYSLDEYRHRRAKERARQTGNAAWPTMAWFPFVYVPFLVFAPACFGVPQSVAAQAGHD
jgi:hypothetical protein